MTTMTPTDIPPAPLTEAELARYREAVAGVPPPGRIEAMSAVEANTRMWADRCRRLLATLDEAPGAGYKVSTAALHAANAILDRPLADPDDDAALVARSLMRVAASQLDRATEVDPGAERDDAADWFADGRSPGVRPVPSSWACDRPVEYCRCGRRMIRTVERGSFADPATGTFRDEAWHSCPHYFPTWWQNLLTVGSYGVGHQSHSEANPMLAREWR